MAYRNWEVLKVSYCDRAGEEVFLEAEIVYPATFLPEQERVRLYMQVKKQGVLLLT